MNAGTTFYFAWEPALMQWLQAHLGGPIISVLNVMSMFGEVTLLIIFLSFIYFSYDKKAGRTLGLSVLLGIASNCMIKNVFFRRRPYFDNQGIKILRLPEAGADAMDIAAQGYSFPSGHSTNAATIYSFLIRKKGWLRIVGILIILLVGISRVVVGAHYPTDVLVGWLLGFLIVALVSWLENKFQDWWLLCALFFILCLPGFLYCQTNDYFTSIGLFGGFLWGVAIDDKFVQFETTKNPIRAVLRVVGALLIYLALSYLLKLPFSKEFLESASYAQRLVRALRYFIIGLVMFGIYPLAFKYTAKIGKK